jgi:hypothetical protein
LLHRHFEAKDRKPKITTPKKSYTTSQSNLDTKESKNRCEIVSMSLHKLHSKGL